MGNASLLDMPRSVINTAPTKEDLDKMRSEVVSDVENMMKCMKEQLEYQIDIVDVRLFRLMELEKRQRNAKRIGSYRRRFSDSKYHLWRV